MRLNFKIFILIFIGFALCYTFWIRDLLFEKYSKVQLPYQLLPVAFHFGTSRNLTYGGINWDKSYYEDGNLTGNELFLHKAFYDLRDPAGPRIRLLCTARCAGLAGTIDISIGGKKLGLEWKKCTNGVKCPNKEACQYWHYDIASKVYNGEVPDKITVHHNETAKEVPLFRSPTNYTDTVSACIGPLYWYNDWIRLIIFIEYWKHIGISKVLLTPSVISQDVLKVINYYKEEGIVETHGWPLLPFTEKVDPNYSVHYVSDNLDTQHCAFWSTSKYTYIGDSDEMLYIRNRTKLFDFLEMWNGRKKDFGGLIFPHIALTFQPPVVPRPYDYEQFITLEGLKHPKVFKDGRFPKSIFMTQYIKIAWVHYPREHFAKKKAHKVPPEEALYLHARENFDKSKKINDTVYPDVKLFADDELEDKVNSIRATIFEIFDGTVPEYKTHSVYSQIYACKSRGSLRRKGCSEPGVSCFQQIHELDDWVYTEPTEESNYIAI